MSVLRRWAAPVAMAVAAFCAGGLALRGGSSGPGRAVVPAALAAPVLSARREPALLSRLAAADRLRAGLDAALGPYASSCLAVRQGGTELYSRRPDVPLIPASNLKLLTATAALTKLGAGASFRTEARFVNGTLWLVGGGDPVLNTADFIGWEQRVTPERPELKTPIRTPLEDLADRIKAAGITAIPGGIMGDETHFDAERYVPTWKTEYITDSEIGPMSALGVNQGFVQFTPKQVPAPAPAKHAADVLANLLLSRGVAVTGDTGTGVAPDGPPVASIQSPSMAAIVSEMLKESDNFTAELITKELGRRVAGRGTTASGVSAVRAILAAANLPVDQYNAVDGSGLDRSDRASCRILLASLEAGGPSGPLADALPVAGRDGTLAKRFAGTPASGRLRAKTGSLENVASLSGFVDEPAGPPLAFSLVVNDLPRPAQFGRAVEDQVGAVLARYPDAPVADQLMPGAP